MTVEIILQNESEITEIPTIIEFTTWAEAALKHHSQNTNTVELVIRIVPPEESAELNKTYRNKIGPTNVLSFSYDIDEGTLGDLAICAELVKQEAAAQYKSIHAHWAHLTVHGILHLIGYDHETESDAHKMETLESSILTSLSYDDPYASSPHDGNVY